MYNRDRQQIQPQHRVNHQIRITPVRVFVDGESIGIFPTRDALAMAQEKGLDLVELVPQAKPPVCHIIDYGKYKYDQSIKQKEGRKKQKMMEEKELRVRPNTDDHDLETKANIARNFIKEGKRVKFSLRFKSREIVHRDVGFRTIKKLLEKLADVAIVESLPMMEGRSISCRVEPKK